MIMFIRRPSDNAEMKVDTTNDKQMRRLNKWLGDQQGFIAGMKDNPELTKPAAQQAIFDPTMLSLGDVVLAYDTDADRYVMAAISPALRAHDVRLYNRALSNEERHRIEGEMLERWQIAF